MPNLNAERPIIEGELFKKPNKPSKKGKGAWKKRYFRLFKSGLKYYKKKSDNVPRGEMRLTSDHYVSDIAAGRDKQHFAFIISDFVSNFYLAAGDKAERDYWMHTIARIIRDLQQKENWFGQPAIIQERTEEQIQRDYQSRLAAYQKSRGVKAAAPIQRKARATFRVAEKEEDAVVASIVRDDARKKQEEMQRAIAKARAEQAEKDRVAELERKAAEQQAKVRAAEEAEAAALAELERADELAKEEERRMLAAKAKEETPLSEVKPKESLVKRLSKRLSSPRRAPGAPPPHPVDEDEDEDEDEEEGESWVTTASNAVGGIASRLMAWNQKIEEREAKQASNVFSAKHQQGPKIVKSDSNYGKAQAGSKTEQRAREAADWVEKEVNKLVGEIEKIGYKNESGLTEVTFGVLFKHYEDVSDSLVGIMMRAKKRKRIKYDGDMLFQGQDDAKKIVVL